VGAHPRAVASISREVAPERRLIKSTVALRPAAL
jgi:hypothetical protein